MTTYQGIDYGRGQTNIDHKTGIRYGVIHHGEVGQAWYEDSEAVYGAPQCPACGYEFKKVKEPIRCPSCGNTDLENDFDEPIAFKYDQDGYKAFQSADDSDIFIEKSLYFTYAQFCSPCAPGACYLMNQLDEPNENNRAYCFGHDWYESGKAPYLVYSVKTGKLVGPDNNI